MLQLNLCIRCRCETVEEAQQKTDEVKATFADHPEASLTSTVNARLEPKDPETGRAANFPP